MKASSNIMTVAVAAMLLSGCATSLTSTQKREYAEYKARGITTEEKAPGLGVALGLLPGGGSFYAREYGYGVVNLLLWPLSILWDPVSGYEGSVSINYFATKAELSSKMKKEMRVLDDQLMLSSLSKEDYVRQRREIQDKYDIN